MQVKKLYRNGYYDNLNFHSGELIFINSPLEKALCLICGRLAGVFPAEAGGAEAFRGIANLSNAIYREVAQGVCIDYLTNFVNGVIIGN